MVKAQKSRIGTIENEFSQSRKQSLFLIAAIVLLMVLQQIVRPGSVTVGQFFNITRQASALGLVVLGQAIVILVGGIDLSVGALVTFTNVFVVAIMRGQNKNFVPGILVCLGFGVLCGCINGFGVVKLKIAPFVMTLCTMSILQGVYLVFTGGSPSGNVSPLLKNIGNGQFLGLIPYATLVWLAFAAIAWWVLTKTPYGRKIYTVGGNPAVANLCGINSDMVKFSAFVLSSVFAVLGGLVVSGYVGTASLSIGNDYMTNSLAAVLIGGNAIEGGKGGVWGTVLGALFMMMLFAVLTMLNIGQVWKLITQGLIIFVVVASKGIFNKGGNK